MITREQYKLYLKAQRELIKFYEDLYKQETNDGASCDKAEEV